MYLSLLIRAEPPNERVPQAAAASQNDEAPVHGKLVMRSLLRGPLPPTAVAEQAEGAKTQ